MSRPRLRVSSNRDSIDAAYTLATESFLLWSGVRRRFFLSKGVGAWRSTKHYLSNSPPYTNRLCGTRNLVESIPFATPRLSHARSISPCPRDLHGMAKQFLFTTEAIESIDREQTQNSPRCSECWGGTISGSNCTSNLDDGFATGFQPDLAIRAVSVQVYPAHDKDITSPLVWFSCRDFLAVTYRPFIN